MADTRFALDPALVAALLEWGRHPGTALPDTLKALGANETWQRLLTPLGDLPNEAQPEVSAPLFDRTLPASATQFGWDWQAGFGAQANLSADLLDADQMAQLGITPAQGHQVIAYSASVSLQAQLQGQQGIGSWGSAGAQIGASGQALLDWYVQAPNAHRLIEAAGEAVPFWRLPNDLEGLLALAPHPMFWGLLMTLDGQFQAGLNLQANASAAGWTFGLDGEKAQIGLSVGVDAGASLALKGTFRLRVTPRQVDGQWGLLVELSRSRTRQQDFSVAFNAGLDLTALASSAEKALRAAWPELDTQGLDALTQPGSAIASRLQSLIDARLADGTLKDLAQLVTGGQSADALRESLLQQLTAPLADELDKLLGSLANQENKADALLDRWLRRLVGAGPLAASLKAQAKPLVDQAFGEAQTALTQAIGGLEQRIQAAGAAALDPVLKPLGELGAQVRKALDQLDQNPLSARLRQVLDRYAAARGKLLDALSQAQKAKLSMAVSMAVQTVRSSGVAFSGWFGPAAGSASLAPAQRLYQALCNGRAADLPRLIQAALDAHAVRDVSGWLSESVRRTSNERVAFDLFGSSFSSSRVMLTELDVTVDMISGRLVGATAGSTVTSSTLNPWVNRTVKLGVAAGLEEIGGASRLRVALQGGFMAGGSKKKREQVQSLVDTYAAAMGLARPADLAALLDAPDDVQRAQRFWQSLTLALPIDLSSQEWAQVVEQHDAASIDAAFLKHGLKCLNLYYRDTTAFAFTTPEKELRERASEVLGRPASDEAVLAYLALYPSSYVPVREPGVALAERVGYPDARQSAGGSLTPVNQRLGVFHRFSAVVRSGAALARAHRALTAALDPAAAPASAEAIRQRAEPALRQLRDALSVVAVASDTFLAVGLGREEGLSWPFTTFALAMAELAGRDVPPGFLPVAGVPGADGVTQDRAIPLLLAG